jgi:hypothetical protein
MSQPAPAPAADKSAPAAGKKQLVQKLKIPAIIAVVVVAEWIGAALFLPGGDSGAKPAPTEESAEHGEPPAEAPAEPAEEPAAHASADDGHAKKADDGHGKKADDGHGKKADKGGHGKSEGGHGAKHDAHAKPMAASKPMTDQAEVDLGNFTVTVYQHATSSTQFISFHLYGTVKHKSADEFAARFEESKHRIRDNVIVIIRSAEMTDLTDAGLGLIKRRILETTNRTLGKPLLQGVVFSEFSFVEQ